MEIVVEEEDTHHMVEVEVVERGLQVEMGRLEIVVLISSCSNIFNVRATINTILVHREAAQATTHPSEAKYSVIIDDLSIGVPPKKAFYSVPKLPV